MAPTIIDDPPFFDLLERSKAAEAGKVVVQAAISYARGLGGGVDFTHLYAHDCEAANLTHRRRGIRASITTTVIWVETRLRSALTGQSGSHGF
jgi:hypothetical protein